MLIDLFLQPGYQWPPLLEAPSPLPSPEDGGLQRDVREERDVTSEPSEGPGDDTSARGRLRRQRRQGKRGKLDPDDWVVGPESVRGLVQARRRFRAPSSPSLARL